MRGTASAEVSATTIHSHARSHLFKMYSFDSGPTCRSTAGRATTALKGLWWWRDDRCVTRCWRARTHARMWPTRERVRQPPLTRDAAHRWPRGKCGDIQSTGTRELDRLQRLLAVAAHAGHARAWCAKRSAPLATSIASSLHKRMQEHEASPPR